LAYIEELLELIKAAFCEMFSSKVKDNTALHTYDFEETFDTILFELESRDALVGLFLWIYHHLIEMDQGVDFDVLPFDRKRKIKVLEALKILRSMRIPWLGRKIHMVRKRVLWFE
jgi:hypothetical protein